MKIRRSYLILLLLAGLSLITSLYAQEKAYPKSGDGIQTFLRRHNCAGYHKEFLELNKGKFGKNNSLLLHHAYILPTKKEGSSPVTPVESSSVKTKGKEPLFGAKLAEYDIVSSQLKGATFYLVCGHGGPDPGAIGRMGKYVLHEDEYAYDITLRLARSLLSHGAKVHIIIQDAIDGIRDDSILAVSKRETCMGDPIPLNQTARLSQRCDKINALQKKNKPQYSRAIFLHIDSRTIHKRIDVFFYHSGTEASKQLAQTMRKTFADKYNKHQPSRGFTGTVAERGLYVLKQTNPVALFVELGNIQNTFDQQRFIISNNRQALANWMCEGFIADYKANR